MTTAELDRFFNTIDVGDVISVTHCWRDGHTEHFGHYRARVRDLNWEGCQLTRIVFDDNQWLCRTINSHHHPDATVENPVWYLLSGKVVITDASRDKPGFN